ERDVHTTDRPVRSAPFASRATAVACVESPTWRPLEARLTSTLAKRWRVTMTFADLLTPSLVTVMLPQPGVTPVTTPVSDTVAMEGRALVHENGLSGSVSPEGPVATAVSVNDSPALMLNVSVTLSAIPTTGMATTFTTALSIAPFTSSAITVRPTCDAAINPVESTVATPGPIDVQ